MVKYTLHKVQLLQHLSMDRASVGDKREARRQEGRAERGKRFGSNDYMREYDTEWDGRRRLGGCVSRRGVMGRSQTFPMKTPHYHRRQRGIFSFSFFFFCPLISVRFLQCWASLSTRHFFLPKGLIRTEILRLTCWSRLNAHTPSLPSPIMHPAP